MTTVYLNGQFLRLEQARISPLDRGFNYGDGVYEVVRAYRGRPFRLEAHFGRLADSLAKIRLGVYLSPLTDVPARLVEENGLGGGDALIYLQVTRGAAPRQHAFPPPDTKATIFAYAWELTPNPAWSAPGLTVILAPDERWARCDIKVVSLVANVLAHQRAAERGAQEALLVRDGVVLEGTLSNFFAVFEGEVRTASLSNYILPGVTRALVLELCREHGIPCRETPIFHHELAQAEELFVSSTSFGVAPIHQLDGRTLPEARPVTERLQRLLGETIARECA